MRFNRILLLVASAAMIVPGPALAQKPHDNGAVDQYTEGVPGANGETPSGGGGGGKGALGSATVEALASQGSDGEAAAALAQSTAPDSRSLREAARRAQAGESAGLTESSLGAASTPAEVFDAVVAGSGDGMGAALPIILGGALLGAIALLVARRRRRGTTAG